MEGRGVKGHLVDIDAKAMPEALRLVPEAVIARVRWLEDGVLTGFPEDGLTVGVLAKLTCVHNNTNGRDAKTAAGDPFWVYD